MNALRQIHAALVPQGLLVDTQPLSPHPPIRLGETELGTLDMRAWAAAIDAVDRQTVLAVDEGLYRLEDERFFVVTDTYDDGPELLGDVRDWQGTQIPSTVERTLSAISAPVSLHQDVRLRLYRTLPPA